MSGFRDDLITILSGGLPALIDGPVSVTQVPQGTVEGSTTAPVRVEEIAPSGTFRDREAFLGVTQNQILIGTAAIIGVLALVMLVRR